MQTKTATFQSGMADAARSARKAFGDIGDAAKSGGHAAAEGTTNVRASLGLLDNTIRGAHGAAMADLIHLFQDSKIVMAALPLAATAGGILLIAGGAVEAVQKIREMREEQEKLSRAMTDFGTAAQNAFNSLDEKFLESEKRADELRNDHLGALRLQLELINRQSMGELEKTFDELAKKADTVFDMLKSHWYTFGIGSDGAKHALEVFQSQYQSLLSQGNDTGANGLLGGTLAAAERVLALQKEAKANSGTLLSAPGEGADLGASMRAQIELKKSGVSFTEKEIAAQETLVQALKAQETAQQKIADTKKLDADNAAKATGNEASGRNASAARAAADSMLRMGELAIAADRSVAQAQLAVKRASVEARLAVEMDFADREYALKVAGNQAEIAALDKSGKDYQNQLKELQSKTLELTQAHETQITELRSRATIDADARNIRDLEQSEREKIDVTEKGSAARLAAIDAGLKTEESRNLQDTAFYRELLSQRIETIRQAAQDEAKARETAGREESENTLKMGELNIAAMRQTNALQDSLRRVSDERRMQEDLRIAAEEYQIKLRAFAEETAALDKSGKDYENKLKAVQDKEKQLTQAHENELTAIKTKAETDRNARILSAEQRATDEMTRSLTDLIIGHQTAGQIIEQYAQKAAGALIRLAIESLDANERTKISDAGQAARDAFKSTMKAFPSPFNLIAAPIAGASAFASMMAFEGGGIVPGIGHGDVVPAMLTPGEGIVPGGVMDGLSEMARSGRMGGGGPVYHVHVRPVYHVNTIDGDGMKKALDKHTDVLQKHFENSVRKMNR